MLDLLDELGIADDTFVQYSTDNGPHRNTWPDGGMTPFRSEKNTNWEGAFRVPLLVRWPGKIKAGSVSNDIVQHHDWLPTFLDDGRRARRRRQAQEGLQGDRPDLQEPHRRLQPAVRTSPARRRRARATSSSTSATTATCWPCATTTGSSCSWSSAARARMQVWAEPFTRLRLPKIFNLRTDPVRVRRHHVEHVLRLVPAQRVLHLRGAGGRRQVRRDVQGVPAGPEAEHASPSTTRWRRCRRRRAAADGALAAVPCAFGMAAHRAQYGTWLERPRWRDRRLGEVVRDVASEAL